MADASSSGDDPKKKLVCTRPPTCQGNCAYLKKIGQGLVGVLCGDFVRGPLKRGLVGKLGEEAGSSATKYSGAVILPTCAELYGRAADYMYEHGDSFTTCEWK